MESKEENEVKVAESHSTPTGTTASWRNFNVMHIMGEVAGVCGMEVYFKNKIKCMKKKGDK